LQYIFIVYTKLFLEPNILFYFNGRTVSTLIVNEVFVLYQYDLISGFDLVITRKDKLERINYMI